ncbi:hypothetical protein NEF87_002782 [Candidatus Lokiarchaeum ossiferum]|uniref:Uncharacterized protein n=1 Tax=Candidatus Lokiarchaeum ossiferum TaxID=2951803 RepID=A0ABY6HUF8_9ARCH|nr:hypothetical protein NEF87_002782 [Candidatus Lokiarchaeum sp. B-35]
MTNEKISLILKSSTDVELETLVNNKLLEELCGIFPLSFKKLFLSIFFKTLPLLHSNL